MILDKCTPCFWMLRATSAVLSPSIVLSTMPVTYFILNFKIDKVNKKYTSARQGRLCASNTKMIKCSFVYFPHERIQYKWSGIKKFAHQLQELWPNCTWCTQPLWVLNKYSTSTIVGVLDTKMDKILRFGSSKLKISYILHINM